MVDDNNKGKGGDSGFIRFAKFVDGLNNMFSVSGRMYRSPENTPTETEEESNRRRIEALERQFKEMQEKMRAKERAKEEESGKENEASEHNLLEERK